MSATDQQQTGLEIAIIGMAGRFPGAQDVATFWSNLCGGVESIARFSEEELIAEGVDPAQLRDRAFVPAGGVLERAEFFDAAFFGYTPREAEIMDPQYRLFLEAAWTALEHAGYTPEQFDRPIGVYAGVGASTYLVHNLLSNPALLSESAGVLQTLIGNDRDHLTTLASYKLNLTGPSLTVQTACSTSLVALHLACQSLLSGECDMALAGAVTVAFPQKAGYRYQDGGINSPDGHCRAFDAEAHGTVHGNGLGLVVLKRLSDAIEDRDQIYAVVKGTALNNDGAHKIGYTAPSIEGQARVIRAAHMMAEVEPDTIGYVETHGTGTPLGDPIEIEALTRAFRSGTDRRQFCAVGSVKSNIGHLDPAAGIAGLIKTTLMLHHGQIPPSLHYTRPNPKIDFAGSPFFVSDRLADWTAGAGPRRAGVSSFGIGGTNAHVVLEEAPPCLPTAPGRPWQLLPISARSRAALDAATANLAEALRQSPGLDLADVAYTLQRGRKAFAHRRVLVARSAEDAAGALEALDPQRLLGGTHDAGERPVAFVFPGQGAQYAGMARDLYAHEPLFRATVDRCAMLLEPHLGEDIRPLIFDEQNQEPRTKNQDAATAGDASLAPSPQPSAPRINETQFAQPALFVIEYALAQLWMAWGVQPQAMLGHSVGEYVAATLAGVFALEDALALVAARGRLMGALPGGAMLAVPLPEAELLPLLGERLSLAAVNAPGMCVVAGPHDAVAALREQCEARGLSVQPLHTSHAFHSAMMAPAVPEFTALLRRMTLGAPQLPFVSNLTGGWISAEQATDPAYWGQHLRQAVRFADGAATLLQQPDLALLEVGPGRTLATLLRQQPAWGAGHQAVQSLRHPRDQQPDTAFAMQALGRLWLAGAAVDWAALHADAPRARVALPTYPFERQRYWIAPRGAPLAAPAESAPGEAAQAEAVQAVVEPGAQHARPELQTAFVAPGNEIERRVAEVWQSMLGIAPVGIHDEFFELGGHSLMAVQLIARLCEEFEVDLPINELYDQPTVAGLAAAITARQIAQTDDDELARLLAEIQDLSPDQLQAVLAAEQGQTVEEQV